MAYQIDFDDPPPMGAVKTVRKRRYTLARIEAYERRSDGEPSYLLHWRSVCPRCREPFVQVTGLRTKGLNAHCKPCVSPTQRARGQALADISRRKRILDDLMG